MPSPDATPYVDLRLFDKDSQDVFAAALVNLQTHLPEWTPREGHTEVVLLEALALEVSEAIFAINRVPGTVVEVMLRLFGIERDLGSPPTATVRLIVNDTAGHDLPAGLRVTLPLSGGEPPVVFTTTTNLSIPAGSSSGTAAAVGDRNTPLANGRLAGTPLNLLDAIVFAERAELATSAGGGADPEDDEAWFTRGISRFGRLVETLVLPSHFVAAALERPEVGRAFAVDNYDPGQGGAAGTHAGHVTVAVYGDGALLTAPQKTAIAVAFDAQAQANLAVHVVDPTVTDVTIDVTVVAVMGFTVAQVQAAVIARLTEYLSPDTWGWGSTVYRNELIAVVDGVEGVQRVVTVTTPASDLPLTGNAPLARLAANPTVTVQLP